MEESIPLRNRGQYENGNFDEGGSESDDFEQLRNYEDFTTMDWVQDSILERNRRLRMASELNSIPRGPNGEITFKWIKMQFTRLTLSAQSWFVFSLAGAFIGINAALISIVTEWLSDIKMGYCNDGWWLNQQFCCWEIEGDENACDSWHPWSTLSMARWIIYSIYALAFSFVAAHLVRAFAKYAAGSGISEIKCIIAGFIMKGYLGWWTLFIKSITLPFVIASGLSVGKEGPSVHVACCIGNVVASMFSRFSQSQVKMKEMVTAASAAGVAVAFGSPIGGVLFSIEEMSHTFSIKTMWRSFFCALVATVALSAMNPYRTGKLVLFQVTYDRDWHFFEIMFFVILGVFGGLYGVLLTKLNMQVAAFRRKHLANNGTAEAVTIATLTALVGYFNKFLRVDMTESLAILFRECESGGDYDNLCQTSAQWRMVNSLLLATVARFGFVAISYGCKVPAGIFIPSMAIGATFGRMIGIMVKALVNTFPESALFSVCQPDVQCITPGTYAFLGAAAALGGVMRITISIVVIMFELTGALTYILPTMIVLLVTKFVGDLFKVRGIADEMIRFNGYPILEKEEIIYNVSVDKVMRTELHTLAASGLAVRDVEQVLADTEVKGFPIVSADEKGLLLGYIRRAELRYVLDKANRTHRISFDTACLFYSEELANQSLDLPNLANGPAIGLNEEEANDIIMTTASSDSVEFWPWVNQTPLTVSPKLPLEIVMQLFKRLGPRVIFVQEHGRLVGLVTVKDVLRFTATDHNEGPSWSERGGIDSLLHETWTWLANVFDSTISRGRSLLRL